MNKNCQQQKSIGITYRKKYIQKKNNILLYLCITCCAMLILIKWPWITPYIIMVLMHTAIKVLNPNINP